MDFYNRLKRNPKQFLAFTGMHLHTFEALYPQFKQAFLKLEQDRKAKTVRSQCDRQRQIGGGNAFQNDLPNRLLLLLYGCWVRGQSFGPASVRLVTLTHSCMQDQVVAITP